MAIRLAHDYVDCETVVGEFRDEYVVFEGAQRRGRVFFVYGERVAPHNAVGILHKTQTFSRAS
jgi:hypothetical protein